MFTDLAKIREALCAFGRGIKMSPRELSLDAVVEEFFAGALKDGDLVRVEGVLSPFAPIQRPLVYSTFQVRVKEHVVSSTGGELTFDTTGLSVPGSRFPSFDLGGSKARLAWLYPKTCDGLDMKRREGAEPAPLADLMEIRENQRPLAVVVPETSLGNILAQRVTVTAPITCVDPDVMPGLLENLDGFQRLILSNCIRPFSGIETMFALDLRSDRSRIEQEGRIERFLMTTTLQTHIELPEQTSNDAISALIDGIPDRRGMPSVQGVVHGNEDIERILVFGEFTWQFARKRRLIGLYGSVDLADAQRLHSTNTKFAAHWQTFQRHARHRADAILGAGAAKIFPVQSLGPLSVAHINNLVISPAVEKQLLASDSRIRESIDWLGVGVRG